MSESNPDPSDLSREELLEQIDDLKKRLATAERGYSRRSVLAAAAGIAAAGATGVYATSQVNAAPSGTFPESSEPALLKIRADRIRLVGRSSDPSSPTDGTIWYRGDL